MDDLVEKVCRSTGASRSDAADLLRRCGMDVPRAIDQYKRRNQPHARQTGVRTLADLRQDNSGTNGRSTEFYAGGVGDRGGGSGLAVLDGKDAKGCPRGNDYVQKVFDTANRQNAGDANSPQSSGGRVQSVSITFWRDGFSVGDDGPLRKYEDEDSKSFMKAMNEGFLPPELQSLGTDVDVTLKDKKSENYCPPPKTLVSFSGSGHTLSGSTETVTSPPITTTSSSSSDLPPIDENAPVTNIVVRLISGKREQVKINTAANISELYARVRSLSPDESSFLLSTSFPRKTLSDMNQTIEEAGLIQSMIVQTNS